MAITFTYTGADRQAASHTLTNGATEGYTRDADENILTVTQPSGNIVVHTYPDANTAFRASDMVLHNCRAVPAPCEQGAPS